MYVSVLLNNNQEITKFTNHYLDGRIFVVCNYIILDVFFLYKKKFKFLIS